MKLRFNEKTHKYFYGRQKLTPVTRLIHKHSNLFDEKKMSKLISMLIQREFLKIEEFTNQKANYSLEELRKAFKETMPKLNKLYGDDAFSMYTTLKVSRGDKKRFVTPTMVKKEWRKKNLDSQKHGTEVHNALEGFITLARFQPSLCEFKDKRSNDKMNFGIEYLFTYNPEKTQFQPEVRIFDTDYLVAGTVDLIIYNEDGTVKLADWKTNQEIKTEPYKGQKMLEPIDSVPDCNFFHYALQLSIYKILIEKNLGLDVGSLELIHLKEDGYKVIPVPFLKEQAMKLLEGNKNE